MIVVLGMHRSGTSLVAHMLNDMGVDMGGPMVEPDWANPHGYWEDQEIMELNARLLRTYGFRWSYPPKPEMTRGYPRGPRESVREMMARKERAEPWGWKDPRTAVLWPLYAETPQAQDAQFVVARRPMRATIGSLQRRAEACATRLRDQMCAGEVVVDDWAEWLREARYDRKSWQTLYKRYQDAIVDAVGDSPHVTVDFRALKLPVAQRAEVTKLAKFVGYTGEIDPLLELIH